MFGGMDPKKMQAMMKKMGIKTEEINADEVIIKGERNMVIKNPHVTVMEVQGQKIFQVTGQAEDVSETEETKISDEDVKMVMEQTGASEVEAKQALEETGYNIAEAIMKLKQE